MHYFYTDENVILTKHKRTLSCSCVVSLSSSRHVHLWLNLTILRIYLKALDLYPQHSSINLKYAGFLRHTRRDIPGAEKFYLKAVEASPNNADALGSYASFLHGVHNNIKEAEKYYQKAVDADDTHTNNLCNYGLFLRCVPHLVYVSYLVLHLTPRLIYLYSTARKRRNMTLQRRCTCKWHAECEELCVVLIDTCVAGLADEPWRCTPSTRTRCTTTP